MQTWQLGQPALCCACIAGSTVFTAKLNKQIPVILVDPAIIYPFVKKAYKQGERVNTSVNITQNDRVALFVCEITEN